MALTLKRTFERNVFGQEFIEFSRIRFLDQLSYVRSENHSDTRERILDVAERLFMENGYEATSMRTITSAAEVNLAAVNYHFGSKEALLCEVFRRRLPGSTSSACRHSTSSKRRLPGHRSSRRRSSKRFSAPCCAWVRIRRWVA
jgi:hypothetical protein